MRMTDGDLWHKCATCVKVYSDDIEPDYDELYIGIGEWIRATRGEALPAEWGDRTEHNEREYDDLCFAMKKMLVILTASLMRHGSWSPAPIEAQAVELMKALEVYFGKEYC